MSLELALHTLITNSGNAYFVQWNLKKINSEIPSKISEPWLYSQNSYFGASSSFSPTMTILLAADLNYHRAGEARPLAETQDYSPNPT